MTLLAQIADRVLNRPLLITPDKAAVILSVLGERIGLGQSEASRFVGDTVVRDAAGNPLRSTDYRTTADGVGIITVTGSLVNRGAWIGASSGLTSYEGIQHQLRSIASDGAVRSVILDLHSPGGEAVGAFETAAFVRAVAAVKPVTAVVNGMAASAAYAIASGATEIVTTETGVSGSIGVVLVHADYSRRLANDGITPTLIFAGAHKADGNPFEPLPDAVRADLQAEVDGFYQAFLATVAKGRGKRLSAAAARGTEARTFIGAAAVSAGLADRLGSFDDVLTALSKAPGGRPTASTKGTRMSDTTDTPAAEQPTVLKSEHEKAVTAAVTRGRAEGAAETTARFAELVAADGIKGDATRMAAAIDLAIKAPGMPAAEVVSFVVANVAHTGSGSSLSDRMRAHGNADLGTGLAGGAPGAQAAATDAMWKSVIKGVNATAKRAG